MGSGLNKFVTERINSFKEKVDTVKTIWQTTKNAYKMISSLDTSKLSDNCTPEELVTALRNNDALPENYKNILSSVDDEVLKKVMKATMESFNMKGKEGKSPLDPSAAKETISKMADEMHKSELKGEYEKDQATLDNLEQAAREQSGETQKRSDADYKPPEQDRPTFNPEMERMFKKTISESRDAIDRISEMAMQESNEQLKEMGYKTPDVNQYSQNNESSQPAEDDEERKDVNKARNAHSPEEDEDPDYIPSQAYRDILGERGINSSQQPYKEPNKGNDRAYQHETHDKKLPPLTKVLGEELRKRFGPRWQDRVPPFMKNPGMSDVPDLGLGLSKEGNRTMAEHMSKVLKDLI